MVHLYKCTKYQPKNVTTIDTLLHKWAQLVSFFPFFVGRIAQKKRAARLGKEGKMEEHTHLEDFEFRAIVDSSRRFFDIKIG